MKILQVNKFHYPRGGADKYFLNLSQGLQAAGEEVAVFSMDHPKNWPSPWSPYFVSRISFNEGGLKDRLKAPGRILYSLEAKKKFTKLLNDFTPDIIHIHNIYHQISPSILDAAAKKNIPVVMHLHDYKLICPNYQLFVNQEICEACRPQRYYKCIQKNCFKKSRSKSVLAALEMYWHHYFLKIYRRNIRLFIAPSEFMKQEVVSFGWPADRIVVLRNPFDPEMAGNTPGTPDDYLLYFGRLSPEKGIETLIKAAAISGDRVKIAGSGESAASLERLANKLGASVDFLGFKDGSELTELILKAKAIVIPSIWAENMPLALLEALHLGKIVIAANVGGLPELVKDGENGLLFPAGQEKELAAKLQSLAGLDRKKMEQAAKASVAPLSPTANIQAIREIYQSILNKRI